MCSRYRWWGTILYCTPPYNWTPDMRKVIKCPQTRIREFQMSTHFLLRKTWFRRIWPIDMTKKDKILPKKAFFQCKYWCFNDFFHILLKNLGYIAYLQEMSTIFREMSMNQVRAVHNFSHVCWTLPGASLMSVLSTKPLQLLDGWRRRWTRRSKIAICWPRPS
jgi:hypothetical protein